MPIQVLMADENQLQLEGLKKLFECVEDVKVQYVVKNDQELLNEIKETSPDVILLDLRTPICNGIRIVRQIRESQPKVKILLLTNLCSLEAIRMSLEAGATGYLLKQCSFQELVSAIRAVHAGNSYFHPMVSKLILNGIVQNSNRTLDCAELDPPLTEREVEILHLIAEGHTNQSIAKHLFISTKTVQTHRRNIMDKLGFHDRVDLVKYAIRKGIIALHE